jgi:hypothetical protein
MADPTADHIVRYLEKPGYVVMKKPPAPGAGDNPGRRDFEDSAYYNRSGVPPEK